MAVALDIGPQGQPPATHYTYDLGSVTLSPRASIQHTPEELDSVVSIITLFRRMVTTNDPGAAVDVPEEPYQDKTTRDGTVIKFRFHADALDDQQQPFELVAKVEIDVVTRVIDFDARPQATLSWGDFLLFVRWMQVISFHARR